MYSLNQKIPQHESHDISEMRQHFCTKFCSFVEEKTVQKCAALCCIYLTCAKLTETQTSGTNCTKILRIHQVAAVFWAEVRDPWSLLVTLCEWTNLFSMWLLSSLVSWWQKILRIRSPGSSTVSLGLDKKVLVLVLAIRNPENFQDFYIFVVASKIKNNLTFLLSQAVLPCCQLSLIWTLWSDIQCVFFVDLGVVVVCVDTEWVIWDFDTKIRQKSWSWSW